LKTLNKLAINYKYVQIISDLSSLKLCNPAVNTLIITEPPSRADLKSLPKLFPNVTDLKITWSWSGAWIFTYQMDLQPINSMKQIRKFEIVNTTEGENVFTQLNLKQLQELRVGISKNFVRQAWSGVDLETVNLIWRTFTSNHSQLKILHIPQCHISVEELQIALENLPLLESLEVGVKGFNYGFATDFAKLSDEEFKEQYEKEQAERAAELIGENYDRFEYLQLRFGPFYHNIELIMLEYLTKHHPNVSLNK
jgi:hypothetical protein